MSHNWLSFVYTGIVMLVLVPGVNAGGPMVSAMGNKHNLSAQNTGVTYHAQDRPDNPGGKQICIFCHTPHNSQPQGPLWNRRSDLIPTNFARYSSSTLKIGTNAASQYSASGDAGGQPNGSSRLCLSCHDGVTELGNVVRSGQNGKILMNTDKIAGPASFHPSTNKMKVGHHPVSFVYATSFDYKTQNGTMIGLGGSFTLPKYSAQPQMADKVKLQDSKRDARGWMQCTTCHDPHQNMGNDVDNWPSPFTRKMTPFWVYSGATTANGHDAVCNSCHNVTPTTPDAWK